MRILNFGLPRTRSSLLIDTIAKAYNLEDLFEPYHVPATEKFYTEGPKISRDISYNKQVYSEYRLIADDLTSKFTKKDNFVCKIFPSALFNIYLPVKNYEFIYESSDYVDFFKSHNIEMYDKIYVTYRKNFTDLICSFLQATKHDFLYTDKNKGLIKFHTPKNCSLEYNSTFLTYMSLNKYFFDYYYNKLEKLNNVIFLEYNDIPKYLESNFPGIQSIYTDAKIDYKKKIKNYSEIEEQFELIHKNCKFKLLS